MRTGASATYQSSIQAPSHPSFNGASDLLSIAAVLPEQFYDSHGKNRREVSGAVALMRAVLTDALACFQRQFLSSGKRVRRLAKEAEEWFFADDPNWLFSFVNICAVLELDPDYIRMGLKRWQRQALAGRPRKKLRRRAVPTCHSLSIAA